MLAASLTLLWDSSSGRPRRPHRRRAPEAVPQLGGAASLREDARKRDLQLSLSRGTQEPSIPFDAPLGGLPGEGQAFEGLLEGQASEGGAEHASLDPEEELDVPDLEGLHQDMQDGRTGDPESTKGPSTSETY